MVSAAVAAPVRGRTVRRRMVPPPSPPPTPARALALAALARAEPFRSLPRAAREELGAGARTRRLLPPAWVSLPGAALHLVARGVLAVAVLGRDGRVTAGLVRAAGDVIVEGVEGPDRPDEARSVAVVRPLTESLLVAVPRDELGRHLGRSPPAALALVSLLCDRLAEVRDALADLAIRDVPARVAGRLLDLSTVAGHRRADGVSLDLLLPQDALATLAGASRESVNRALAGFVADGWVVVAGRRYVLRDPGSLARRAGR